jgi:hypothetical protein
MVRRIWGICIVVSSVLFVGLGGLVYVLLTGERRAGENIVYVSTSVFQVLVLTYGVGFFVPAFLTSLMKMDLGIRMSRRALEIGDRTAQHIDRLQSELTPVLTDLKSAVANAKVMLEEVRSKDLDKIQRVLSDLTENNRLERFVSAIERLASRIESAPTPSGKSKEDLVREISG